MSIQPFLSLQQIDEVANAILARVGVQPQIGLILGSGLGSIANTIQNAVSIPYHELPYWPASTVGGHAGRLVLGQLEDKNVLVMQGRNHFYEGHSMSQVTLPVRVMRQLGIRTMIVTNAAGAVNPDYIPGDLMLITDHINLVGMTGFNPLVGPNLDELGPRFPDMSQTYDRALGQLARQAAQMHRITLREGVYVGLSGPSFETPAELRFLRTAGADAVGMSTTPEVVVARHCGLRVLGISGISNKANLDGSTITSHAEVLEAGEKISPQLEKLIRSVLPQID